MTNEELYAEVQKSQKTLRRLGDNCLTATHLIEQLTAAIRDQQQRNEHLLNLLAGARDAGSSDSHG